MKTRIATLNREDREDAETNLLCVLCVLCVACRFAVAGRTRRSHASRSCRPKIAARRPPTTSPSFARARTAAIHRRCALGIRALGRLERPSLDRRDRPVSAAYAAGDSRRGGHRDWSGRAGMEGRAARVRRGRRRGSGGARGASESRSGGRRPRGDLRDDRPSAVFDGGRRSRLPSGRCSNWPRTATRSAIALAWRKASKRSSACSGSCGRRAARRSRCCGAWRPRAPPRRSPARASAVWRSRRSTTAGGIGDETLLTVARRSGRAGAAAGHAGGGHAAAAALVHRGRAAGARPRRCLADRAPRGAAQRSGSGIPTPLACVRLRWWPPPIADTHVALFALDQLSRCGIVAGGGRAARARGRRSLARRIAARLAPRRARTRRPGHGCAGARHRRARAVQGVADLAAPHVRGARRGGAGGSRDARRAGQRRRRQRPGGGGRGAAQGRGSRGGRHLHRPAHAAGQSAAACLGARARGHGVGGRRGAGVESRVAAAGRRRAATTRTTPATRSPKRWRRSAPTRARRGRHGASPVRLRTTI